MSKYMPVLLTLTLTCMGLASPAAGPDTPHAVTVTDRPAERRVEIAIDGRPFTSYLYPTSLQKPVLYPIRSAGGAVVTRGYPLEPRPGERADHPHHVGHWFNYGEVNGYDFWGHSEATPAANKPKMGTIVHKGIARAEGGAERGELAVTAEWVIPDGTVLLTEETRFVFSGGPGRRAIDRTTTWRAADRTVSFTDTKEGAFGIRVARPLDHPAKGPEPLVTADGTGTERRVDPSTPTGRYIASDGRTGEEVWGTRGPWMGLTGTIDGQQVTLAILDHPSNHGHPTYWHARGYGLFAANPIGQHGYDPEQKPVTLTLQPGESLTFRHRILVQDGHLTAAELNRVHEEFAGATR
jgi:hypothetical protein